MVSKHWANALMREWTAQALLEQEYHLKQSVTSSDDPLKEAESQIFFISFFAKPLLELTVRAAPNLSMYYHHCKANLQSWHQRKAILYKQHGAGGTTRERLSPPPPPPSDASSPCPPLHASRIGITPHFPSPFQITDPSLTTILHEQQHLPMTFNLSHPPVNLNHFHHQPCSLLSPMFRTTLQPPRLRVLILPKILFRVVMQLSGLRVSRVV
jgi:hypothetical protein